MAAAGRARRTRNAAQAVEEVLESSSAYEGLGLSTSRSLLVRSLF
jgi:hypothetical protein